MSSLCLATIAVALVLQVDTAQKPEEQPEASAVQAVLDKYASACDLKNWDEFSSVFAHEPRIVMIPAFLPERLVGWKNVSATYKALFLSDDTLKVHHKNVHIQLFASGNAACLTCDQDARMTFQGQLLTYENVRMSWVLEKQEDTWRVIHAHWSLPAELKTD